MVHCTKCHPKNEKETPMCTKWGVNLVTRPRRYERGRSSKQECFGLPHGGTIAAIVIGIIIILVGVSSLPGIEIEWWPLIIIIFGILVVAGALYKYTRRY